MKNFLKSLLGKGKKIEVFFSLLKKLSFIMGKFLDKVPYHVIRFTIGFIIFIKGTVTSMINFLLRLPEQATRLLIVFVVLVTSVFVIRQYVIPSELKETGFHRVSAIEQEVSKEIKYAGTQVCMECHDDHYMLKMEGHHKNLSCETCHGPANGHPDDPTEITPPAPRKRQFCPLCHTYDPSRPTGFPQINPITHNPMKPCMSCHDPHNPEPPELPRECTACHAEIGRTLAVSHHALLECTTCHKSPEEHKITPRLVKPTKPSKRVFCGKCHSAESTVKGPPKIDLLNHEPKYVCWQCHYPHMPRGR